MAEHEQISINDLRSDQPQVIAQNNEFTDPNLQKELSTEKRAVTSAEIGLPSRPKEVEKDDIQNAYDVLDQYIEKKQHEVEDFNKAIDNNGGELSELQWRAMNGDAAMSVMVDGVPQDIAESGDIDRYEDMLGTKSESVDEEVPTETNIPEEDPEMEQLEREAQAFEKGMSEVEISTPTGVDEYVPSTPLNIKDDQPKEEKVIVTGTSIAQDKVANSTVVEKYVPSKDKLDYEHSTAETGEVSVKDIKIKEDIDDIDKDIDRLMNNTSEEDTTSKEDTEDYSDRIKEKIKEKMSNTIIPISDFKIVTDKPITATNVLSSRDVSAVPTFKWALYHTGIPFAMSKFYAHELDDLRDTVNAGTDPKAVFRTIHKHIVSGASSDFIRWTKSINRLDINNLWMGVYGACFQFSNYLPYDCEDCKNIMITDGTKIREMVKFKTPEIEKKFDNILSMDFSDENMGAIHSASVVPISSTIAIATKEPTIYDTVIEPTMLDDDFSNKYSDIVRFLPFIQNVFFIDQTTRQLRPIAYAQDPRNEAKTLKFKVLAWAKIFRTFNSDEQGVLINLITKLSDNGLDEVQYCLPAITCDKCGKEIPESVMGAADLVFIRHQLTLFGAV